MGGRSENFKSCSIETNKRTDRSIAVEEGPAIKEHFDESEKCSGRPEGHRVLRLIPEAAARFYGSSPVNGLFQSQDLTV